jgi:cytidylate kinase
MDNYVITIARGFGSKGCDVADRLGEILKIPVYDRQLLTMASEQSGIDENLFAETNEKLRGRLISGLLRSMPRQTVAEPHEKGFISDINLFNIQAKIIGELAQTQSCIILGKCADNVLKENKNVITAFISAPEEYCIKTIHEKLFVSDERAKQLIRRTDRYRGEYYRYYTWGKTWNDPLNYDMSLNTAHLGVEGCAEVVSSYISFLKKSGKM